jgi:hypothetical protein
MGRMFLRGMMYNRQGVQKSVRIPPGQEKNTAGVLSSDNSAIVV